MDIVIFFYILLFVVSVLIPLSIGLAKDGAYLYRETKKALADGVISDIEMERILEGVGRFLTSIVRLGEAVLRKLGKM